MLTAKIRTLMYKTCIIRKIIFQIFQVLIQELSMTMFLFKDFRHTFHTWLPQNQLLPIEISHSVGNREF